MAEHIVLMGDSIFDNSAYTAGEPDVNRHLQQCLPKSWRSSLLAVDGSTTRELAGQVGHVPSDATQLVVSIGGNDALLNSDPWEPWGPIPWGHPALDNHARYRHPFGRPQNAAGLFTWAAVPLIPALWAP